MPTNEQRRETAKRKLERQLERRDQQAKRRRLVAIIGGIAAVVVVIAAVVTTVLLNRDDNTVTSAAGDTESADPFALPGEADAGGPVSEPPADGKLPPFTPSANLGANCQYPAAQAASKDNTGPRTGRVPTDPGEISASLETNEGNIGLILDNAKSPCTVNSFASLAQQGYFNDTVCHRLTTGPGLSVLQCGDPTGTGTGGPGYQFANEYPTDQYPAGSMAAQQPVIYPRGTLAMANAGPGTNGSQFFLVYADSQLPPQYTVFGRIDDTGLGTLDRIAAAGTADGSGDGTPKDEIKITQLALD